MHVAVEVHVHAPHVTSGSEPTSVFVAACAGHATSPSATRHVFIPLGGAQNVSAHESIAGWQRCVVASAVSFAGTPTPGAEQGPGVAGGGRIEQYVETNDPL